MTLAIQFILEWQGRLRKVQGVGRPARTLGATPENTDDPGIAPQTSARVTGGGLDIHVSKMAKFKGDFFNCRREGLDSSAWQATLPSHTGHGLVLRHI
ncbi:MAG TPA: hypothetical protein VJA25_04960 [Dehalococcoidia bacterium]|nr:hypothetical protein [Dehalococcoidia bacterium]